MVTDGEVSVPAELAPLLAKLARRGLRAAVRDDFARFPQPLHDLIDRLDPPSALREAVAPAGRIRLHPATLPAPVVGKGLTPAAAAERLGLTRQGVMKLLHRGRLPGSYQDDKGRWHVWLPAEEVGDGRSAGAGPDAAAE